MKRNLLILTLCFIWANSYSQRTSELIKEGDVFVSAKNYVEAIKSYSSAIALDSTKSETYFKRGQSRAFFGDYSGAQIDYGKATELDTNYVAAYIKHAYACLVLRQITDAIYFYTKGISKDSNQTAKVYFERASCYQYNSLYQQALNDYGKVIQIEPTYADAFLNSGGCARQLKEYGKAFDFFDKALNLVPQWSLVYYLRGFVYLDKGELDKACSDWTKAVELGHTDAQTDINQNCKK